MKRYSMVTMEGVEKTKALMDVCLGKSPVDMAVVGGTVLNVYTGEWIKDQVVLVKGEWIVYAGQDLPDAIGPEATVVDAKGKAVIPGLIEGHTHLADCLYSPAEFLRYAMVGGTTTIVTESIEPFPARGEEGINDFLDAFKDQPIKVFATVPPLASTSPLSHGMPRATLRRLLERNEVLGLGESYWQTVLQDPYHFLVRFEDTFFSGRKVEGHSAGAKGRMLHAYVASGISSCHEPITADEALERLRLGLHVMVREGSIRSDLSAVVVLRDKGIDHKRLILVTDGVRPVDLVERGYMEHVVQKAIDAGIDPVKAIQMATINVADYFGLEGLTGGIAPGKQADFLILPDAKTIKPEVVVSKGKVIARNGELIVSPRKHCFAPESMKSVHLERAMTPGDFRIGVERRVSRVRVRIIEQITDLVTKEFISDVPVSAGEIRCDPNQDLLKVAAVERRFVPGKTFVGLIRGFGLRAGAMACSSAWDTSDIIVVGAEESDMAEAVNRIHALQGGMVLLAGGKVLAEIPLPIFGLMSNLSVPDLARKMQEMTVHAKALGFPFADPHRTLIPLTGAAIPFIRISEQGLVNIKTGKALSFIVE